jgi:hypothetical protein
VKRAALIIAAVLGVFSVTVLRAPDAAAADTANDCAQLRERASSDGLALAVDNNCDRRLSCTLSWTLQCESATGRVTRRTKDGVRIVVGASASQTANVSAKGCGDNWRIEEVSWDCSAIKEASLT